MISDKMLSALNEQLNHEHFNAMLYLSLSASANFTGYLGAQSWLYKQYEEELEHMEKLAKYILDQNRVFVISKMDAPATGHDNLVDIFTAALAREKVTTKSIFDKRKLAVDDKDQSTEVFLQWYVNEQVQEENTIQDILNRLKIANNTGAALLQIDAELGSR